MRVAWFSPMPPARTGVATCSAELVAALGAEHDIDVFVHETAERDGPSMPRAIRAQVRSAHDFIPTQIRRPYDLIVYQLGNSSHHDYQWPYLFRYPGLAVLHDAHLHHARAAALLRDARADDYRAEFAANHPGLNPALAELAVAGFDNHLYYLTPMTHLVARASRATAVHTASLADELAGAAPGAAIEWIHLAHGSPPGQAQDARTRGATRRAYGVPEDAVVFGVFGGLTPEKRIPQVLSAFSALLPYCPSAHLLLAGPGVRHYDVMADVEARGLANQTTGTGYVDTDEELTGLVAAADVSLNLRWPTAREVSGPWLRALGAGVATITTDLAHLTGIPSLDPRTWTLNDSGTGGPAVTIAIDILDEDHSLGLAMRRLAADATLRLSLAAAGREFWQREHSMERMLGDYRRVLELAAAQPVPLVALPPHLAASGDATLQRLLVELGMDPHIWSTL